MCLCVCTVNLIRANREKWINNRKANTVADRGEKGTDREGQAETDGEKGTQVGGDSEVTGLTGEIKSRRDTHTQRERYGGGLGDSQEAMS